MADRFKHADGLKSQDITLRGNRLEMARKASRQNEARRLQRKEMGSENLEEKESPAYFGERREALEEAGGKVGRSNQAPRSTYLKRKSQVEKEYKEYLEQ